MSITTPGFWVVIPAAGTGKRMRADRPKQYLPLAGRLVLEHTLSAFIESPLISGIVVALDADDNYWPQIKPASTKPLITVAGGEERCHSVLNALQKLAERAGRDAWVLVHDAARPCITHEDIERLIAELEDDAVGGILAIAVHDTLKKGTVEHRIATTVDRSGLWRALTPQMFRLGTLTDALQTSLADGYVVTDEASAIEHVGLSPRLVLGRADNIKITQPEDLSLAEYYLRNRLENT